MVDWRKRANLPQLQVDRVKTKVDTGNITSALRASDIEYFSDSAQLIVRFKIHPLQWNASLTLQATGPALEQRSVRNSGGQAQVRPVIRIPILCDQQRWEIDLTLTNRDRMSFRILLGREAMRHRFLMNPAASSLMRMLGNSALRLDELDESRACHQLER